LPLVYTLEKLWSGLLPLLIMIICFTASTTGRC
jgi:hypothetical protein